MRKLIIAITIFCIANVCASDPTLASKAESGPERNAILLKLSADPSLNYYDGAPHQLALYVYQLTSPDELQHLSEDSKGLSALLEGRPAVKSIASFTRTYLHPGKTIILSLNRAPAATHIAIVAGYHSRDRESMIRLLEIPMREESKGIFNKTTVTKPEKIEVELHLGSQAIGEQTVRSSKLPDYAPKGKSIFSIFR